MRRFYRVALAVALVAALVTPVLAQPSIFGPGGMVNVTTASVAVTNTVAATTLYTYQVPAGLAQNAYAPLHLKLLGVVTTNQGVAAVGAMNIGCNYGGTTASIALSNGQTLTSGLSRAPWMLDLWVTGYSGANATTAITGSLQGRFAVGSGSASVATESVTNAQVDMTTPQNVNQTLVCSMQWGSAAATNSLIVTNGVLVQGQ